MPHLCFLTLYYLSLSSTSLTFLFPVPPKCPHCGRQPAPALHHQPRLYFSVLWLPSLFHFPSSWHLAHSLLFSQLASGHGTPSSPAQGLYFFPPPWWVPVCYKVTLHVLDNFKQLHKCTFLPNTWWLSSLKFHTLFCFKSPKSHIQLPTWNIYSGV